MPDSLAKLADTRSDALAIHISELKLDAPSLGRELDFVIRAVWLMKNCSAAGETDANTMPFQAVETHHKLLGFRML